MNQYFEQMILSASPLELIRLLHQRAITSVREARRHLADRCIMERGRAINNAYLVLVELGTSLRKDEAPQLAARLGALYVYMQKRLLEANLKQQDAPLAEVLGLLTTLAEGWAGVPDSEHAPVAAKNPWLDVIADEPVRFAVSA